MTITVAIIPIVATMVGTIAYGVLHPMYLRISTLMHLKMIYHLIFSVLPRKICEKFWIFICGSGFFIRIVLWALSLVRIE